MHRAAGAGAFGRERAAQALGAVRRENALGQQLANALFERKQAGLRRCGQHGGDHLLVLFRLQRTGGVDDAAAGADGAQCGARIARWRSAWRARSSGRRRWRISGLRPSVPVPLQGTSASTRSKAASSASAVASARRHSTRSPRGQPLAATAPAWARWIPSTMRPAGCARPGSASCRRARRRRRGFFHVLVGILAGFGRPARPPVASLRPEAHAALAEGFGRGYVAGDDGARGGEQFAGFEGVMPAALSSASTAGLARRTVSTGWLWPWRQIARAASMP
jgi:hypothetical protein